MTTRPAVTRSQIVAACLVTAGAVAAACARPVAGNLAGPAAPERQQVAQAPVVASRPAPTAVPAGSTLFDFQVEKPAVLRPGTLGPAYPAALRAARKEGTVLAQYVVTASGEIDASTFKVLKSDDPAFTDAVRDALPKMPYLPALVGGRPVRQLVQMPFTFSMNGTGSGVAVVLGTPRVNVGQPQLIPPRMDAADSARVAGTSAALLPDFVGPVYPEALRAERIEGRALVQLVVNADGTADLPSLKVLKSDHPLFTDAVKTALANARFSPATVQGRPVRQLMQLPFEFKAPND